MPAIAPVATTTVPDPAYLTARFGSSDPAARSHPGLEFEGFPFALRGGLPTPTTAALEAEIDRLLERHGHLLTTG